MKKFFVYAKSSPTLDSAWWKSLSPEQQAQYIKDHPNSKYAIAAKKKEEENSKRSPAPDSPAPDSPAPAPDSPAPAPDSPAPAPDSPAPDSPAPAPDSPAPAPDSPAPDSPEPDLRIDVDDEDEDVAINAVRKKLSEMNFGEIAKAMRTPPKDGEGFNGAHALAFGLCFLVALTLIVALPETATESVKILASQVANNYYESITKSEEKEEEKKKKPKLDLTREEQENADERKASNRQLGYDENGNPISDNEADRLTRLFLRNRRAIV